MTKKNNGNPREYGIKTDPDRQALLTGAHIFSEAPVSQELLEKAKETGLL